MTNVYETDLNCSYSYSLVTRYPTLFTNLHHGIPFSNISLFDNVTYHYQILLILQNSNSNVF